MSRFTAEHGWPLYLATLSYGAITIRHSTAPESPRAFEGAGLNTKRPMLISALGRAWLAFCTEEERRSILQDIGGLTRRQENALNEQLARVRREGVAFTQLSRPTRLHGIAVPVMQADAQDSRVVASLSMRFPRSAISEAEAAKLFGRRLQALARAIASDIAQRTD